MINCTNIWIFLKINECILSLWVAVNSCSTIVARCTSFKCALRKISDKLKKKKRKKKKNTCPFIIYKQSTCRSMFTCYNCKDMIMFRDRLG